MAKKENLVYEPEPEKNEPPNYGLLILQELKHMNRLLGAINQKIGAELNIIKNDLEICRNHLAKIKKAGPSQVSISDNRASEPIRMPASIPGEQ